MRLIVIATSLLFGCGTTRATPLVSSPPRAPYVRCSANKPTRPAKLSLNLPHTSGAIIAAATNKLREWNVYGDRAAVAIDKCNKEQK